MVTRAVCPKSTKAPLGRVMQLHSFPHVKTHTRTFFLDLIWARSRLHAPLALYNTRGKSKPRSRPSFSPSSKGDSPPLIIRIPIHTERKRERENEQHMYRHPRESDSPPSRARARVYIYAPILVLWALAFGSLHTRARERKSTHAWKRARKGGGSISRTGPGRERKVEEKRITWRQFPRFCDSRTRSFCGFNPIGESVFQGSLSHSLSLSLSLSLSYSLTCMLLIYTCVCVCVCVSAYTWLGAREGMRHDMRWIERGDRENARATGNRQVKMKGKRNCKGGRRRRERIHIKPGDANRASIMTWPLLALTRVCARTRIKVRVADTRARTRAGSGGFFRGSYFIYWYGEKERSTSPKKNRCQFIGT